MNLSSVTATIAALFRQRRNTEEAGYPVYPGAMRDPQGNTERYAEYLHRLLERRRTLQTDLKRHKLDTRLRTLNMRIHDEPQYIVYLHAAGAPLADLGAEAAQCMASLDTNSRYIREHGSEEWRGVYALAGHSRFALGFAAIALLLVPDAGLAKAFHRLVSPQDDTRNQLFDLLVKAFDPAQPVAAAYAWNGYLKPWTDPVLRALALPAERRAAALAAHMENWTRLMRPHGWKPDLDTGAGSDPLFSDFAFEVALAVCGWDIDDSSFAHHPYYPRELVQHYRAHIRHTRDAWRAGGAGAGVPVDAPAAPVRSGLAGSPRKGLARWFELVSDGDQAATDAALAMGIDAGAIEPYELAEALNGVHLGIDADIKDDDSVAARIHILGDARGLGDFTEPAQPPAGIDRCIALLRAWDGWLAARGYRLVPVDLGNDGWNAVVVRGEYLEELRELSSDLGIPLAEPATVYSDG